MHIFTAAYLTAALHEAAHIIAAKCLGIGISRVEIMPFGVSAKLSDSVIRDPNREILVAAAGPALNLTIAAIILILKNYVDASDLLEYAANINIAICLINLIPALPLDGGRIFKAVLSKFCGTIRAYNASIKISRVIIVLLLMVAVAIFLTSEFNFSLILTGVFMLGNLSYEKRAISSAALKEFMYSESKVDENHTANIHSLAVKGNTPARLMLKSLNYNRYCIAVIIDDKMKIKRFVSESEIINALVEKGVLITLDEV